ncbi:hypothetical protein EG329_013437 [Mollisiaceae sp. DMI_Dod_QoI]|nr:hypothetical protein EG329_013437 [Helotiales sp. DMI_Dod_QoI]
MLDIAVSLYGCAHIEQPNYRAFELIGNKSIILKTTTDRIFGVGLRNLGCLNGVLRSRKIWVFHTSSTSRSASELNNGTEPLYLSTSIKVLGDLWGPVWGVCHDSQPGVIRAYEIGGGSIIPWKHDPSLHPRLRGNERLCHWHKTVEDSLNQGHPIISHQAPDALTSDLGSSELPVSYQLTGGPEISPAPFSSDNKLLIGASPPRLRFEVCRCQKERIVAELQNTACLYPLSTVRGHHYIDSTSKGISGGQYINLNASKMKKWEKMITWKQTILEEWEKNPALRGQSILIPERFVGVVVSLCTFNATRVRLVDLFKTDSMRLVLADFRWTITDSKQCFCEALDSQDHRSIRRLWRDREDLRDDIGNAISACLRIPASTGYDQDHEELNLLWIPSFQNTKEMI